VQGQLQGSVGGEVMGEGCQDEKERGGVILFVL